MKKTSNDTLNVAIGMITDHGFKCSDAKISLLPNKRMVEEFFADVFFFYKGQLLQGGDWQ